MNKLTLMLSRAKDADGSQLSLIEASSVSVHTYVCTSVHVRIHNYEYIP